MIKTGGALSKAQALGSQEACLAKVHARGATAFTPLLATAS